jgi:hypothetical protein
VEDWQGKARNPELADKTSDDYAGHHEDEANEESVDSDSEVAHKRKFWLRAKARMVMADCKAKMSLCAVDHIALRQR